MTDIMIWFGSVDVLAFFAEFVVRHYFVCTVIPQRHHRTFLQPDIRITIPPSRNPFTGSQQGYPSHQHRGWPW